MQVSLESYLLTNFAHVCSEISPKMAFILFWGSESSLNFLDFFVFSCKRNSTLECEAEFWPFLTNFGTSTRAIGQDAPPQAIRTQNHNIVLTF